MTQHPQANPDNHNDNDRMRHGRYHELLSRTMGGAARLHRSLLCACLLFAFSCGGATFSQGIYDDGVVRYRVGQLGAGWQRVEVEDNDLAFSNRKLGTISINSTCEDYEDVPEEALMNHLLFGTRERSYRVEETITVDGRGAAHTIVDVELDGVPLTIELIVLKRDGCVYDMSLIASREAFEQSRQEYCA